jgi:hypothetical protein
VFIEILLVYVDALTVLSISFHLREFALVFAWLPLKEGCTCVREILMQGWEAAYEDMMEERVHYNMSKAHACMFYSRRAHIPMYARQMKTLGVSRMHTKLF